MAAMGLRQIEKVGGGFLCAKQGGFQSPAVSARQWWWSLFPAAGEEIGNSCGLLLDPGSTPHQQEQGTGHCVFPNLPDTGPVASGLLGCGQCLLLRIPLLAKL